MPISTDRPRLLIVTGGSRGIGAATARLAAARGWAVCLSYRDGAADAAAVEAAIRAEGGRALAVQADIANEAEVLRLFEAAEAAFGPVGALVNNAGITGGKALVAEVTADTLHGVFATNVVGSILAAREAVRRMSTARGGQGGGIVNVSSTATKAGSPGEWVHYAASKGAIDVFTGGLAREVADQGIRVNAVAPGHITTPMVMSVSAPGAQAEFMNTMRSEAGLLGTPGTGWDVGWAVGFLASDEARWITGAVLPVDGGVMAVTPLMMAPGLRALGPEPAPPSVRT
jgi:NAD(P)-dependent dehydrogenase (short-subunit alcohol dehydrogenase family)